MTDFVAAVDPGKKGALALLDKAGKIVEMTAMPLVVSQKSKDELDLVAIVNTIVRWDPSIVVVEKQHAMPAIFHKGKPCPVCKRAEGQQSGSLANYNRGYSRGSLEGICVALKKRYALVAPQTWQAEILKDTNASDTKAAALIVARRLWPEQTFLATARSRKPHDGLIDACCLGMFALRRNL